MSTNRVAVVEGNLDAYLEDAVGPGELLAPDAPLRAGSSLTARRAVELFEDPFDKHFCQRREVF